MSYDVPTYDEWLQDALTCNDCPDNVTRPGAKLCWKHNIQYMQIAGTSGVGERAHTHRIGEPKLRRSEPNNAWERGIARDHRGVPILNPNGTPVRMKQYSENRHSINEQLKRMQSS